ncbi:MAG: hypothetical protein IH957_06600 [Chloroflexi bacterium]|nr:hypothetical protein [Chloroflexota bacterium]
MNERERADWLARTIDDLLRGKRQATTPDGLDENDVGGLLRAASTRMGQATDSAKSSLQYEGAVWRQVLQRLDRRRQPRPPSRQAAAAPGRVAQQSEPPDAELGELSDIIAIRRKMTDEMMSISDSRRGNIWRDLKTRLESKSQKKGWFSFLRRSNSRADRLSPALDSIAFNAPLIDVDPDLDGLLVTAHTRKRLSLLASEAADGSRDYVWDRIRTSLEQGNTHRSDVRQGRWFQPRWALAAAASVVVVVAVGLIPVVGLSQHPVAEAARFVGSHLGVTEIDSAPPNPMSSDTVAIDPVEVNAAEASALLGVNVVEPEGLTEFELTSSQFFSQPITGESGGTFVLTYRGSDPAQSLVIYQELSSGGNLTAGSDSATSITLPDGTEGTYIDGAWQVTSASGLSWGIGGTQTLVVERDGVRTIIRYTGPRIEARTLIAIAGMMG